MVRAQGRRATRLRYAPTCCTSFILKHSLRHCYPQGSHFPAVWLKPFPIPRLLREVANFSQISDVNSSSLIRKLIFLFCFFLGLPIMAQTLKSLQNLDKAGVALQGYDPVAFFSQRKTVKGTSEFQSSYKGAKYYFASAKDKSAFDGDPAKYQPQFGGFCAYGVSRRHTAPIKIEAFQIVNGRLLMQFDLDVKSDFNKDQSGNLAKADHNWPSIVKKKR
jgi:YHS domain-containing protein